MDKIQLRCQSCQGTMEVDEGQNTLFCPYCGAKELIPESDAVKIEKVKAEANMELERQRIAHEDEKEKRIEEKEQRAKFVKSWYGIGILILAVISLMLTFSSFGDKHILAGFIAFAQTCVFVLAWLVGMNYIHKIKRGFYILLAIIGLVLFIPFSAMADMEENSQKYSVQYNWPSDGDLVLLEKPKSKYGEIIEFDNNIDVSVYKASKEEYLDYISKCKERGFKENAVELSSSYTAYNTDGYELHLYYWDSEKKYTIKLIKPEVLKNLNWPSVGMALFLDEPQYTTFGEILSDDSKLLHIKFVVNSIDDFEDYVVKCQNKGFIEDYSKSEKYYTANDINGNNLKLEYWDDFNKTVIITLAGADEKTKEDIKLESTNTSEIKTDNSTNDSAKTSETKNEVSDVSETSVNTSSELINGMRPEFKKAMDDYEAFYDEYVAFMNKYSQNPSDLTLLMDYAKMMDKAAKMDESFEKWEDGTTNDAELAYYIQVQSRINQKLMGVLQ